MAVHGARPPASDDELVRLLRSFFGAYRERFEELMEDSDAATPWLTRQSLDVVRVNGGRSMHFFFAAPRELDVAARSSPTRLHDVTMFPAKTDELKEWEDEAPDAQREQVRRTAEIGSRVYLHFVVYPEDGALEEILVEVAARVAEHEVELGLGAARSPDGDAVVRLSSGMTRAKRPPKDDWIEPDR